MKKHIRGPAGLHNPVIDDEHQHTEDLFLSYFIYILNFYFFYLILINVFLRFTTRKIFV